MLGIGFGVCERSGAPPALYIICNYCIIVDEWETRAKKGAKICEDGV